jgi:hypothetical protein
MSTKQFTLRVGFAIALCLVFLSCAFDASILLHAQTPDGQSKRPASSSAAPSSASAQEFPVTMRQNVVAGKTPVGTKVEAKLTIATLLKGAVIPQGAIFSGEVTNSEAKSKTDPSRLALRMDSVQWKAGSQPITLYLTAWYYPVQMPQDGDKEDCRTTGMNCPTQPGMSGNGTGMSGRFPPDPLPPPPAQISTSRVAMKDVEFAKDADGTFSLTSTHSNIKLDKTTTYVLATGDLTAGK